MAPAVSEGIQKLSATEGFWEKGGWNSEKTGVFGHFWKIVQLKNSKWRIQYDGQVIVINFYKPRLPYCIRHFEFLNLNEDLYNEALSNNFQLNLINF